MSLHHQPPEHSSIFAYQKQFLSIPCPWIQALHNSNSFSFLLGARKKPNKISENNKEKSPVNKINQKNISTFFSPHFQTLAIKRKKIHIFLRTLNLYHSHSSKNWIRSGYDKAEAIELWSRVILHQAHSRSGLALITCKPCRGQGAIPNNTILSGVGTTIHTFG